MLGSTKLQGIGYVGSCMVGTLRATMLISVMPYKMEGANRLKILPSEEHYNLRNRLERASECGKCAYFV